MFIWKYNFGISDLNIYSVVYFNLLVCLWVWIWQARNIQIYMKWQSRIYLKRSCKRNAIEMANDNDNEEEHAKKMERRCHLGRWRWKGQCNDDKNYEDTKKVNYNGKDDDDEFEFIKFYFQWWRKIYLHGVIITSIDVTSNWALILKVVINHLM